MKPIPIRPAAHIVSRFIPNPSPTTEACSKYFVIICVVQGMGLPMLSAKTSPAAKATGGEIQPDRQAVASTRQATVRLSRKWAVIGVVLTFMCPSSQFCPCAERPGHRIALCVASVAAAAGRGRPRETMPVSLPFRWHRGHRPRLQTRPKRTYTIHAWCRPPACLRDS